MFANQHYYTTKYLKGKKRDIPADEFDFWADKAQRRINWRGVQVLEVPDYLAGCCCEVAEQMYRHNQQQENAAMPPQKVGSFSIGRGVSPPEGELERQVQQIIESWRAGTEMFHWFAYRGI